MFTLSKARSIKTIVIIDGHVDGATEHYGHELVQAYATGARKAGHLVHVIEVARLEFPLLRNAADFETGSLPEAIRTAQESLQQADHILIVFPLWLGSMPAILKGFLEQLLRPSFAVTHVTYGLPTESLSGKSAHVIVTIGLPWLLDRWTYRANGLKSFERNILSFSGIKSVRATVIGMSGSPNLGRHLKWLKRMNLFGAAAR